MRYRVVILGWMRSVNEGAFGPKAQAECNRLFRSLHKAAAVASGLAVTHGEKTAVVRIPPGEPIDYDGDWVVRCDGPGWC